MRLLTMIEDAEGVAVLMSGVMEGLMLQRVTCCIVLCTKGHLKHLAFVLDVHRPLTGACASCVRGTLRHLTANTMGWLSREGIDAITAVEARDVAYRRHHRQECNSHAGHFG